MTADNARGWRTIESAPRDGAQVMIAVAGKWVSIGRWHDDDHQWREINNDPTDAWGVELYPTHWQPLPPPPEPGA